MHSELVVKALEVAKEKASLEIQRITGRIIARGWQAVEHGWYVSTNMHVSGLDGSLRYTFMKPLKEPIHLSFGAQGAKWEGYVDTLFYKCGFTHCNTKDIDKYTLQYSCEAVIVEQKYDFMPVGYSIGWGRGLTKADMGKFKSLNLLLLPAIENPSRYMMINDELRAFKKEERENRNNLFSERKTEITLRQSEIFKSVLSSL